MISEIPEGEYKDEVKVEANEAPVHIKCRVIVRDESIKADYSGTSGCVSQSINVPLSFAQAWTAYGVKCVISPSIPNNEASLIPLEITVPEGCILSAPHPSPVAARHLVGHFLPQVIFGALAEAVPHKVMADSGLFSDLYFYGKGPRGLPLQSPVMPIEIWEASTGLLVEMRPLGIPEAT